jgi:hypothetical protein
MVASVVTRGAGAVSTGARYGLYLLRDMALT